MNGKGSARRPKCINEVEESKRWEEAFGKKIPWWERRDKVVEERVNACKVEEEI